jgi:hypothetical protein
MSKFKPTAEQIDIIKKCAVIEAKSAGFGRITENTVLLEPGIRCNLTDHARDEHMNIALVTYETDSWGDTDLADYGTWADFRKGIELAPNGRGIFDFYLRQRNDPDHELISNITVYVIGGKMHYIDGVGGPDPIWRREGGFVK